MKEVPVFDRSKKICKHKFAKNLVPDFDRFQYALMDIFGGAWGHFNTYEENLIIIETNDKVNVKEELLKKRSDN